LPINPPPAQEKIAGSRGEITTEIIPCPEFYYAEDYHQQYLAKPGARPYCSAQPSGIPLGNEWVPEKFPQPTLADNLWAQNGPKVCGWAVWSGERD
jgi:peptide-methionine (S)-S-oxide reductase